MRSFESLCEDLRDFARVHPGVRDAIVSDAALYGGGMDCDIVIWKMRALSTFARDVCGLTLYVENRSDDAIVARPDAREGLTRQEVGARLQARRRRRAADVDDDTHEP